MKCKKCNVDITQSYSLYCVTNDNSVIKIPNIYRGYPYIPYCERCGEVVDYKDFSLGAFWGWLSHTSEKDNDLTLKRKALIRYFGLDELLQCNAAKEV